MSKMESKKKVLDSHIHLFGTPQLANLAWMTPQNKLYGNHTLDEYQKAIKSDEFESIGCIFIETDVKSGLEPENWDLAIEEYLFVERIVNNKQLEGEGEAKDGKRYIKGIIPWAPVPLGSNGLAEYVNKIQKSTVNKDNLKLIKGFRYLLQDKENGTMLKPDFIDGLNWLSINNYVFDLGIDIHSRGLKQLEELVELDSKTTNVKFIVNHLCKPDFDIDHLEYVKELWLKITNQTSNEYYIKLSGAFSELSLEIATSSNLETIADKILPWVQLFNELFGSKKIIFGSDWPVSTFKFDGNVHVWDKWCKIVDIILIKLKINRNDVFWENSFDAYNIN